MAFSISSADALNFRFRKTGGAKMTMRIAVFQDPGTPRRKRVRLLFVGNGAGTVESPAPLPALAAGSYEVVGVIMIEEAVSGTYDYEASLNGHVFAARAGDVKHIRRDRRRAVHPRRRLLRHLKEHAMTRCRHGSWVLVAACLLTVLAATPSFAQADKKNPVVLLKETTGQDAASLKSFLADQGAASVSAAALAGIGTTPLTVVQDTKDFAVLLSPFDKEGKGGGFVITPARVRNPLPRIDLMTEYVPNVWWRIVAATNISGAQGKSDVGGKEYRRRAFALATGAFFDKGDDPIYQRAVATLAQNESGDLVGDTCLVAFFDTAGDVSRPTTGGVSGVPAGDLLAKATATYKACVEKAYSESRKRWFAPRWSLAYGTGDAQPAAGGPSVRTGDVLALGVTYGRPWRADKPTLPSDPVAGTILSGWAVTVVARHTRDEAVLASLGTGPVQRQNSSLVVGRLAAGTEAWRLMVEASNNDAKKAAGGERTMKQALGLDWRVAKDSWLNLRYGKRIKTNGSGDEGATLMTLTLGGDLLTF